MKIILLTLLVAFLAGICAAQPKPESGQWPIISADKQPSNVNIYSGHLLIWVDDLRTRTDEWHFRVRMNIYYSMIRNVHYECRYTRRGMRKNRRTLQKIESAIREEVVRYNSRSATQINCNMSIK